MQPPPPKRSPRPVFRKEGTCEFNRRSAVASGGAELRGRSIVIGLLLRKLTVGVCRFDLVFEGVDFLVEFQLEFG